jgi:phosphoribosyl 1,2-cyclic phosphate phosphodiesterase
VSEGGASAPRAVILGSGTSNGVPMLGVQYSDEFLANPKNHRNRSCLFIEGKEGNLLVDCPPELRLMCTGAKIYRIDQVLVTHSHADHVMGMDDLRSICMITGKPMDVYTLPPHQNDIRRIFCYAFQEFPAGVVVPRFSLHDVPSQMQVGELEVTTFTVRHGSVPVTGLRVNNLAYITDVSEIPDEVKEHLRGLEVFVVDAVRYKPHPNHFHFDRALEVAQEIGAKRTYLTHLSADYDHDATNASLPAGIELAFDGLSIPL